MNGSHTTRRTLLQGAALTLAAPAALRAAPAQVNAAYFLNTSPFMISKGEGWIDQAAGTKVNWIEVGSGAEINTGIAAGSIDIGFGIGSSPTASGISQGIGYEVIAMMDNIGPAEEMTVRKTAQIKTPADFKGKKVATPFGSTSHFRLLGFLKTNGLTQGDVTVLDLRGDAMVAAWIRGDIDAGYVWSPSKSKLLEAGGEVFKTYDRLEAAGYVIADLIVARTAFATANPDMLTAILAAYGRSLDMYTAKPDDAAVIVGKQAGVSTAVAKADMAEYDFVPLKAQLTPAWLGSGGTEGKFATVLKGTADFLVEQKSIRSAPGVAAFAKAINTSYLAKAVG
ncbi:MAG: ABC transporter substrate-binding protein [Acetobacteraceae bacterium]